MKYLSFFVYLFCTEVAALKCAQCNGWNGYYPGRDGVSTCDNRNNLCDGAEFCVKIVDPIIKKVHYTTYKSDCYYTQTLMNGMNTTQIKSGKCYPYSDGGNPERQYLYCFCNNHDFCNSSLTSTASFFMIFVFLFTVFICKL